METFDRLQYQIVLVAPRRQDYKTAAVLLQDKECEYTLSNSGALCTLGKIGSHHFVLAGDSGNNSDIALFVRDTANDLLAEFPSIRVGLLIGVDAIAPTDGIAQTGDVVVGTPQGLEPGLVQFDALQTTQLNRLSVTHHMSGAPYAVQHAVDRSRSWSGRREFQERLFSKAMAVTSTAAERETLSWSKSVRFRYGKIASSQEQLSKDDILNKVGRDSKILCFERSAARLTPQLPFLTICGVTKIAGISGTPLAEQTSGIAAVAYAMLIIGKIDPYELETEHHFTNIYSYKTFELERPGFRLVRLQRGVDFPLRCSLFQAYLDDEETIMPYEGLSYVWGTHNKPDKIDMDGKTISVTRSLHSALCRLRRLNQDRILWVDALCIDQSNIKERSHQVNHMGEIYRKADNVIIWLGHLGSDADFLRKVIDHFAEQLPSDVFRRWSHEDPRWLDQWHQFQSIVGLPDNTKLINGLNDFMQSPWFSRVWILQEVANAKRAVIESNLGKVNAKLFAMLPHIIGSPVSEQCQAVLDIMPGPSRKTSWWSQDRNLCTLLCKFKGSEASDPRDRVYALLGMASDMGGNAIEADYTKEEKIIIRDLCVYIYNESSPGYPYFPVRSIRELQSLLPTLSRRTFLDKLERKATVESLLSFMSRQGMLSDEDVSNTRRGDHYSRTYQAKCQAATLSLGLEIVGTPKRSLDVLHHLLQRKHAPPTLTRSLVSWMVKTDHHDLRTFLKSVREDIDPGPELALDLMERHPTDCIELLKLVFGAFPEPIKLDESSLMYVIGNVIDKNEAAVEFLLQHSQHPIMISNSILLTAISAGIRKLQIILETPNETTGIQQNAFLAAAKQGPTTLLLLLEKLRGSGFISDALLYSAILADQNDLERILQLLPKIPNEIDGQIFVQAAEKGSTTAQLLFGHCENPVYMARKAIDKLVFYSPGTLNTLLEASSFQPESRQDLVMHAKQSSLLAGIYHRIFLIN